MFGLSRTMSIAAAIMVIIVAMLIIYRERSAGSEGFFPCQCRPPENSLIVNPFYPPGSAMGVSSVDYPISMRLPDHVPPE